MRAMRVVLQRVTSARVSVEGEVVGRIGHGLVAFVGVTDGDSPDDAATLGKKTSALRLFADEDRPFHLSVRDIGGAVLVISQFTLHGDVRKGNRPSWSSAARPAVAEPLVAAYAEALESNGARVSQGRFGANMQVELLNDGPVTLVIDSEELRRARPR